ncbi:torsin-1A-like [Gordionus sp. m RMFG-2023]|uniref:torsin-1A-like n=1 Tax=Gordionus sp. m RMFG-2023 TaxID=3053472 RepID=UPI0031FDD5E0
MKFYFILFLHFISNSNAFEPISSVVAMSGALIATSSIVYHSIDKLKCLTNNYECCNEKWIPHSTAELHNDLKTKIYGQHIAIDLVYKAIYSHIINKNPEKPLVISIHGWTGNGKTYTSQLIAKSLYKLGMNSKYVHLWIASLHFAHESLTQLYIDQIRNWIKGNTTRCPHQLFIIDEMDFMSSDLTDAIKPFLDYHPLVDGIDFRKNIYIFISNVGGNEISKIALEFWDKGKSRESMTREHFNDIISQKAFNQKGGLQRSSLIDHYLIDLYVPFLPLERSHVKLCVRDALDRKTAGRRGTFNSAKPEQIEQLIESVANELTYYPPNLSIYSTSGCKRIPQKLDFLYMGLDWKKN